MTACRGSSISAWRSRSRAKSFMKSPARPPNMAPEQARGQGERVDARTDVYGLGAVLYYLLTGQPPHQGKTLNEVIEQARDAPVVPPREINPRVPRALERVCLKATAADPQSRRVAGPKRRQCDACPRTAGLYNGGTFRSAPLCPSHPGPTRRK